MFVMHKAILMYKRKKSNISYPSSSKLKSQIWRAFRLMDLYYKTMKYQCPKAI